MDHRQVVKRYVLEHFLFTSDESAVANDDSLLRNGVIDSTGILELITHVEETFGISVSEEEMVPTNFDSIDAIAAFLARKHPH